MTAEEIKSKHSCLEILESRGFISGKSFGKEIMFKCPFHEDKTPSFSVNPSKDVWHCHAGCGGGSVIDLIAKFEGIDPKTMLARNGKNLIKQPQKSFDLPPATKPQNGKIVATYTYQDANGNDVYQALRYENKKFSQRRKTELGWEWGMDGVVRVLYNLPQVRKAQEVWVVEGEKDAETLEMMGFTATTNVGGSSSWLESYAEHLVGKDLILCGDNDEPGRKHIEEVKKTTMEHAKTIRVVTVPSPHKDITDYINSIPDDNEAREAVRKLSESVEPLYKGEPLPLYSMEQLEQQYIEFLKRSKDRTFELGRWLPALKEIVLYPGDMMIVMADTGVGKSLIFTNLHLSNHHLTSTLFSLELSKNKIFSRTAQTAAGVSRHSLEAAYRLGSKVKWREDGRLGKFFVCPESRMTLEFMESIIKRSELITGEKPAVVYLDYAQLMQATGKDFGRYSRFSEIAEGLKRMAKALEVVIIVASQVSRDNERGFGEMTLHDAKESGSLENSCGVLLGVSRNPQNKTEACVQVLKSTDTGAGSKILCNCDFETMRITQQREYDAIGPVSFPPSYHNGTE